MPRTPEPGRSRPPWPRSTSSRRPLPDASGRSPPPSRPASTARFFSGRRSRRRPVRLPAARPGRTAGRRTPPTRPSARSNGCDSGSWRPARTGRPVPRRRRVRRGRSTAPPGPASPRRPAPSRRPASPGFARLRPASPGFARRGLTPLAARAAELEIVEPISHGSVRQVLKKTSRSRTADAAGRSPRSGRASSPAGRRRCRRSIAGRTAPGSPSSATSGSPSSATSGSPSSATSGSPSSATSGSPSSARTRPVRGRSPKLARRCPSGPAGRPAATASIGGRARPECSWRSGR